MLNVVFYNPPQTKSVSYREYDENGALVTHTVETTYHTIRDYACETLTSAKYMFAAPGFLDSFTGSMISLNDAEGMFMTSDIEYVTGEHDEPADFSSLTIADSMFAACDLLESVNVKMPSLVSAKDMFAGCTSLTSFNGDMSSLENGEKLFTDCPLTEISGNFDSLSNGKKMFKNKEISIFDIELPSLHNGEEMFTGTKIVEFNHDLGQLENGTKMFYDCQQLTSFSGSLSSLRLANDMFAKTKISSLNINAPMLTNADRMCQSCKQLASVNGMLNALYSGAYMFNDCDGLFNLNLYTPNLEIANSMFEACSKLTYFTGNLSKLRNGNGMFKSTILNACAPANLNSLQSAREMFYANRFENWKLSLPELTDGYQMFYSNTSMKSFIGDMPKLTSAQNMFANCTQLREFRGDLSSVTDARGMFHACPLSATSVLYIISSLPVREDNGYRRIAIGTNCAGGASFDLFAMEAGFEDGRDMHNFISNKGWEVDWQDSNGVSFTVE